MLFAITLLALQQCEHFAEAIKDGIEGEPLALHYLACKATMKQEVGEVVSFYCVNKSGEPAICWFDIKPI